MEQVFLSRRNLETLLAKLDAKAAGEQTACTIMKMDTDHPKYPCSNPIICTAVENSDYYVDRLPGAVHPREEEKLKSCEAILEVL